MPSEADNTLVERLHRTLGGITTPMMQGDNLAVTLCSYFENADQEVDDESSWTADAVKGQDETLDAIRAHYAEAITTLTQQLAEAREALEPFALLEFEDADGDTQIVWETIYNARVKDWFSFQEFAAARAALEPKP